MHSAEKPYEQYMIRVETVMYIKCRLQKSV